MRFPLEVVRSVRAAVPRTVPLGARITGTEWLDNGLNGDDAVAMAKALTAEEDAWPTIGPSALPFGPGWHTPAAMTEEDMARVTAAFTDAAKRSLRIGFDAIELHFAHGYLPVSYTHLDVYKRQSSIISMA